MAAVETIYLAADRSSRGEFYHLDPECPTLKRSDGVRDKPFQHRPLRSKPCSVCGGDD